MEFSLKLRVKSAEKKRGGGGLCFWIKIEGHMKKNQAHQSKIKQHTCSYIDRLRRQPLQLACIFNSWCMYMYTVIQRCTSVYMQVRSQIKFFHISVQKSNKNGTNLALSTLLCADIVNLIYMYIKLLLALLYIFPSSFFVPLGNYLLS